MKSILMSIRPEWCELIANGMKTIEVRKTKPKLEPPFKVYIYCTLPKEQGTSFLVGNKNPVSGNGKVIGEFICENIKPFDVPYPAYQDRLDKTIIDGACLTYYQLHRYAYHDKLYAWHISDLKIYDKPKELYYFGKCHQCPYGDHARCVLHEFSCNGEYVLRRPPQSWCYAEEI